MSLPPDWDPFASGAAVEVREEDDAAPGFDPFASGAAVSVSPRLDGFLARVAQDPELDDWQREEITRTGREAFGGATQQDWSLLGRLRQNALEAWTEHTVAGAGTRRASLGQGEIARGQLIEGRLEGIQREIDRRAGRLGDVMTDPTYSEWPDELLVRERQRLGSRGDLMEARRRRQRFEGLVGEAMRLGTYEGMPDAEGVAQNAAALTGQVAGGMASPENLPGVGAGAGFSLGKRVLLSGATAAATSLATEPLVQASRQEALQQELGFDWGQAGEGALFGFAAGALFEAAPDLARRVFRRLRRRSVTVDTQPDGAAQAEEINRIVAEELAAVKPEEQQAYRTALQRHIDAGAGVPERRAPEYRENRQQQLEAAINAEEWKPGGESRAAVVAEREALAQGEAEALRAQLATAAMEADPRTGYATWWERELAAEEALRQSPQGARRLASGLEAEGTEAAMAARLQRRSASSAPAEIEAGPAPADPRLVDPSRRDPLGVRMMPPTEVDVGQSGRVRPAWSEAATRTPEGLVIPPVRNVRSIEETALAETRVAAEREAPRPLPSEQARPEGGARDTATETAPSPRRSGEESVAQTVSARKGKTLQVGPAPDGQPDLLSVIEELGGAPGPKPKQRGGEYDGYNEAFGRGAARLLRRAGKGNIDRFLLDLAERGYRFESVDRFYAAVSAAVDNRARLAKALGDEDYGRKFDTALMEGGKRGRHAAGQPLAVDELKVGDRFKVRGEPVKVTDIDPDTNAVRIEDGVKRTVPAGTTIHPDKGSLKRGRASTQFLPPERELARGIADFVDEATTPPPATAPKAAPGALGITAPGLQQLEAVRNRLNPQSALPRAMRDALRIGEDRVRGYLAKGQAVLGDLRSAVRGVGDAAAQERESLALRAYLSGRAPLAALGPKVRAHAMRARAFVDGLSDRAVRDGVVTGELAEKFTDNLGSYLRRSYRIFADADYRPDAKAVTAAIDAVERTGWSRDEAARLVNDLLARHQRAEAADFLAGRGKLAGRDVSSLVARKDLLPEIRALLGEIEDPLENLGQTIPRLARLVEMHHAQRRMRDLGLKLGVFRDVKAQPLSAAEVQGGGWVPLVSKQSSTHEAWRGLHATPEVADAIQRGAASGRWEGLRGAVWEAWRAVSAASKVAKTVLNPDSFAPNFLGGLVMGAANGNFRVDRLGRGLMLGAEETGLLRWLQERGLMAHNRPSLQAEVAKLTSLGLRGEGLSAADLAQNIERSVLRRLGTRLESAATARLSEGAVRAGKAVASAPFVVYRGTDDVTKYVAWKSEMARYARAFPGMRAAELERYAAEVVRATMPTYSEVPKWLREASQLGLSPTFINFSWEVFRNTANSIRIGTRDLRMGTSTGNRQLVRAGAERLAALTAALGLASTLGLSRLSRDENGVTNEQDEAVRALGAPWNRNAALLYNSGVGEDGRVQFSNLSYLLPHAVLFEAAIEAARAQTADETLGLFARALGEQFLGIENSVVLGALLAATTGRDANDRRVINPESPTVLRDRVGLFIDRALRPAVLDKLKRVHLAMQGELSETGRSYSLSEEAKRLAAMRAQTLDAPTAARWRARDLGERWRNATALYRGKLRLNLQPTEIEGHYQRSEVARKRVFEDLQQTYRAARALNVSEDQAIDALRAGGLPSNVVLAILDGSGYVAGDREQKESVAEIFAKIRQQPLERRKEELRRLALEDPALLRSVAERQREESRGINQRDRLIRSLGVADGERAAYIRARLDAMGSIAERRSYLRRLAATGALTETVAAQLRTPD